MLQQTQVATVIPYWLTWMASFPTAKILAEADEQQVLSIWQGLGYYRRCRNLLAGAKWVSEHGIPTTLESWLEVPGVGRYTAGAISSIAQGQRSPLVDGNVERVYARLTGDHSIGKDLHSAAWVWAEQKMCSERPGDWNQALMELGAMICTPKTPKCMECPLSSVCVADSSNQSLILPRRSVAAAIKRLNHAVWVPGRNGKFGVRQIPKGQWWEGMWEFPRAETNDPFGAEQLRQIVGEGWVESFGLIRHSVTHHRITIEVSYVRTDTQSPELVWLTPTELAHLPMPAPQRRILKMILKIRSPET